MTHDLFVFAPAVVALIVMAALLHEYRRPRARTPAEKQAVALLRSWLSPEQEKQWQSRGAFDVIGCDTGRRYRITYRGVMNVHQLDADGHPVQQWCASHPKAGLPWATRCSHKRLRWRRWRQRRSKSRTDRCFVCRRKPPAIHCSYDLAM
jgi:hypothetical protein